MQPEPTPASEGQNTESLWDGTPINPDTLPPELQPLAKQLQGAFTRKTQELAEERRQLAELGDLEEVQQAVELYHRIQEPDNWPRLHAQLTEALEQMGMSPAAASAEATRQMQEAQSPAEPELDLSALKQDPELAPVAALVERMQARLDSFEQAQSQREAAEQAERMQMQLVGELTRQEAAIRQANPDYKDRDVDMVYEISSFYGGNLMEAQERLESYFQERLAEYLEQKQSAPTPAASAPTATTTPFTPITEAQTIRDVEEGAVEYLRQLQAAGELDI